MLGVEEIDGGLPMRMKMVEEILGGLPIRVIAAKGSCVL